MNETPLLDCPPGLRKVIIRNNGPDQMKLCVRAGYNVEWRAAGVDATVILGANAIHFENAPDRFTLSAGDARSYRSQNPAGKPVEFDYDIEVPPKSPYEGVALATLATYSPTIIIKATSRVHAECGPLVAGALFGLVVALIMTIPKRR
jgi:hypothetical protein